MNANALTPTRRSLDPTADASGASTRLTRSENSSDEFARTHASTCGLSARSRAGRRRCRRRERRRDVKHRHDAGGRLGVPRARLGRGKRHARGSVSRRETRANRRAPTFVVGVPRRSSSGVSRRSSSMVSRRSSSGRRKSRREPRGARSSRRDRRARCQCRAWTPRDGERRRVIFATAAPRRDAKRLADHRALRRAVRRGERRASTVLVRRRRVHAEERVP